MDRTFLRLTFMSVLTCSSAFILFSFGRAAEWNPDDLASVPVASVRLQQLSAIDHSDYFLSPSGNDDWSGTLADPNAEGTDGPFRTFERARDAVRQSPDHTRSLVVTVRGGIYERQTPFILDANDSGQDNAPVVWRAAPGENVLLTGGKRIPAGQPLTDPQLRSTFSEAACDAIRVVDLAAAGLTDTSRDALAGSELFVGICPTWPARYPNDGFMTITAVESNGTSEVVIHGRHGIREGFFKTDDPRVLNWVGLHNVQVMGYWFWDWSEQLHEVDSIDPTTGMIRVRPPYNGYGYRVNQWFYACNILSELDAPGEMYIDNEHGLLYYIPPTPGHDDEVLTLSMSPNILDAHDVSNLIWSGFTMEGSRDTALQFIGGSGILVAGCTIRNVGGSALTMSGQDHTAFGCHVYQTGRGGISISGGDRPSLTPGRCAIINCDIHDYARRQLTYAPAVSVDGVGNLISHNRLRHAPHMAIGLSGNEHRIEYNEVSDVCRNSNDAGALYTGRNWTARGNVVQYNYFHDISGFRGEGCVGVYLDDMLSSVAIRSNLFVRVTRAAMIGGGRDNEITNNVFVDCHPSIHVDERGLNWAGSHVNGWIQEAKEKGTISGIRYNVPPWSTRYPKLASILADQPGAPMGNIIERNLLVGPNGDPSQEPWPGDEITKEALPYIQLRDNLLADKSIFAHPDQDDYHLVSNRPQEEIGFVPFSLDKFGLFEAPYSACEK